MRRFQWMNEVLALVMFASLATAQAQSAWPQKPIRIVVPFAPGGNTDSIARVMAERFTQSLGQPVLVDNRPGADGRIGTQYVANANPDGLAPLPFVVGKDVAITAGKVVYRNHLIELIQYAPATDKVAAEPVLIIPSPIMKFYILDLSQQNSMVRYLVAQGFTVFMISWRNPDANDRDLGMEDYLVGAVMQAMRQASAIANAPTLHTMGYCLGGTFLAIVAALMGAKAFAEQEAAQPQGTQLPLPQLASVTLLAAQTDFSESGELGIFIDDDQCALWMALFKELVATWHSFCQRYSSGHGGKYGAHGPTCAG
jgi:hypothetical protein